MTGSRNNDHGDPPVERSSIAEQGDDQLLDAILRGRASDTKHTLDARMNRLMTALEAEGDAPGVRTVWFHRMPALARGLAACLLLSAVVGIILVSERQVLAEPGLLQRAIDRLAEGDSTYLIRITPEAETSEGDRLDGREATQPPDARGERPRRSIHPGRHAMQWRTNNPAGRRPPGSKSIQRLDGAVLHTRGDEAVFLVELPGNRVLARGFKGSDFWSNFEPDQTDRLLVESSPSEGPRPDRRLSNLLRFATLDLPEMLDGLERHYTVTGPEFVEDGNGGPALVRHLAVASQEPRPGRTGFKRPRSIEIWTDPESERIVEVRLDGASNGVPDSIGITLTLQSTASLDDAVFEPASYEPVKPRKRPPTPERRTR